MNIGLAPLWLLITLCAGVSATDEEPAAGPAFTPPPRAEGWTRTGDIASYSRDSLFTLMNGEAELYFPYGFRQAFVVTYASDAKPEERIDAEVFQMGSPLDAFGIYSHYREEDDDLVALGAEGYVGSTLAMFYQDRYFVKLRFNTPRKNRPGLVAVGRAVASGLPGNKQPPAELRMLQLDEVSPKTTKYIARGLLGYDFFRRGLIARAKVADQSLRVLVVFSANQAQASQVLARYTAHLDARRAEHCWTEKPFGKVLVAKDPLHGDLVMHQVGPYLVGVTSESGGPTEAPPTSHVALRTSHHKWFPVLAQLVKQAQQDLARRRPKPSQEKSPEQQEPGTPTRNHSRRFVP